MAITTASDLAAGQIAMVGTARMTYEHRAVCTNIFTRMALGPGEKSMYIPKFGALPDAADLTDGVDMTQAQSLTISGTTHTTDEAGIKVIITKKLRSQLKEDAYRLAGRVVGDSIARKIDKDGLALFSGLSNGLGSASTTFSISYLVAGITQLKGQSEPAPEPYACVLHPFTFHQVVKNISQPGTSNMPPDFQMEKLREYWRGNDPLYSVPLFIDGNITPDSSDDAYGAIFSKIAFIYLVGWEPENWLEEDKSLRGWEIGVVADYAMVEEDDAYGRYLLFDAAKPTS